MRRLAATLGSKSAFKKLPKRSVMTADISQLCQLIATPAEPLALRLSSNLLVGAARIGINNWPVKQEIFISDVTTCFNSLKRVELEFRSMTSPEGQLQMAQPSVKLSAVTLRADPRAAFSMEFDAMVANWDEYLNIGSASCKSNVLFASLTLIVTDNKNIECDSDSDYHLTTMKGKGKGKAAASSTNLEFLRATACTLPENHDFLLANSFDASFGESGTTKFSSSQIGGFGFDDTFDGLDIEEGVGDDLVRELGEGWGANPIEENPAEYLTQFQPFGMNFDTGDLDDGTAGLDALIQASQSPQPHVPINSIQGSHIEPGETVTPPHASRSPPVELAIQQTYKVPFQQTNNGGTLRKVKRARPLLDVRTELTDEELKAARMYYLDKQNTIRCELEFRRFEKRQDDLIHSLLWDAPGNVHAKELVDFWVDHFKAHVNARSGLFCPLPHLQAYMGNIDDTPMLAAENWHADQIAAPMDGGDMVDFDYNIDGLSCSKPSFLCRFSFYVATANWGGVDDYTPDAKNLRSSEEPGQARRAAHSPPTFGDNLSADVAPDTFHSQRSALFPWDMAGASSSVSAREGGIQLPINNRLSVDHADARLRGSSVSQRGSSLLSFPNPQSGVESPAVILPAIQSDDDFIFDVPGDNYAPDSRQPEANRIALEKNSYNFLEYARMQYRSLPSTQCLVFDDVVPKVTSTARVAAAALYHCLVLATKDLLQVNQEEPYGRIDIRII
ncbi:hypothetical protein EV363DRAFT_1152517 [Boletus edulis]|nr:hypothetical protein EV363DRAFT_1152517 [Boletus edulis]